MMPKRARISGFTLVELMLAMTFVSVLMLAIALTSIQAGRMYSRGTTLRGVNQAGRNISDTIRRDFLQSNAQKVNAGVGSADLTGAVILSKDPGGRVFGGRICLGYYSYVWNTAAGLASTVGTTNQVRYAETGEAINLLRVIDAGGNLCRKVGSSGKYPMTVKKDESTELLERAAGEAFVSVHDFKIEKIVGNKDPEALYRIRFMLGTNRLAEIDTINQQCRPPNDAKENINFCAINNFEMIVRTNG